VAARGPLSPPRRDEGAEPLALIGVASITCSRRAGSSRESSSSARIVPVGRHSLGLAFLVDLDETVEHLPFGDGEPHDA